MSKDWYIDIYEFHNTFLQYIGIEPKIPSINVVNLRKTLIKEEIRELLIAINENNIIEIADGIVDSIVVLIGTAISYGIDIRPIWDEIHKTNMAKFGGNTRSDGKILKPENWIPPNIKRILEKQLKTLGK